MATVSIITPAYNAEKTIAETILSVQNQTFADWEMIIADDNSTDRTREIIQKISLQDSRIKYLKLPGQSGPAEARNAALTIAKGRYICFLDSDDLWLPAKLEKQIEFLKKNDAGFCFSQFRRLSYDGTYVGRLIPVPQKVDYSTLLKHNVIGTLTTMIDTQKTGPLKMVNEGYDDFILWLHILKKVPFAYGLQEDLARYRIMSGSVSSKKLRAAKWVWNIYRNVEQLPMTKALWIFLNYMILVSLKHSKF